MWGPKGLFSTHAAFEWGVAMLLLPMKLGGAMPSAAALQKFEDQPLGDWFRSITQDIARLKLYDAFYSSGWTMPLARRVRRQLVPVLVQAVTVVWYGALHDAQRAGKN